MKTYNILFTGTGRRVELIQAFREAALVLNKNIKIYGADMTDTAPALAFCDFTRIVPAIKNAAYIPTLLDICKNDEIDILIPTIDTDLLILAEAKGNFETIGTKVLISKPDKISICRDKNITSQFFVDCGLKAPMPVNDWREYKGAYPAFIKPKDGSSSINAYKVDNEEELQVYAEQVPDYIVQPFIEGTEYTVDIFCDFDGNPISIVPRIRLQVRTGEVIKTQIDLDETIIEECKAIIERFKPCGPFTVQLIRDNKTGANYYIEINPRFGGGSPLSMKAGARSAETILKLLSGDTETFSGNVSNGAIYSRFDQSVRVDMKGAFTGIRGVIFDLDDTLYSEKDYVKSGYNAVAGYLGDDEYANILWSYFEQGKPAIDELLNDIGRIQEKAAVLETYRNHIPQIELYEGTKEVIAELKKRGLKVGIITDGRPNGQRNKIHALGLHELINDEDIIITDALGGEQFRKPCDIAFRIIQRRWRIPFEQMIYVGDNPNKDTQAPRQLGMKAILIENKEGLYTDRDGLKNLDKNMTSIESLLPYLRAL